MSSALRISAVATAALRRLDPLLSESAIDEIDRIAVDPSKLRVDPDGIAVHDFDCHVAGQRYVVFVTF